MKMDKLWIMFFVIAAGILYVSANAFAQVYSEECLDCSVCEVFEELKQECIDVYNSCVSHNIPDDICGEINEYCEGHLEDTIVSCKKLCSDDCDEQETCVDGAPDGNCDPGENCPGDASACNDTKCYEPTCTNGCGETPVPEGKPDEACGPNIGCATPPCSCDGNGNCIESEAEIIDCKEEYGSNYWCSTYDEWEMECKGNGEAIKLVNSICLYDPTETVKDHCSTCYEPEPECHQHEAPEWLTADSDIKILEKGCTDTCGTEYHVEFREKNTHCGERLWVWLEPGTTPLEADKCYRADLHPDTSTCGPMIVNANGITCPECEETPPCASTSCESANTNLPCMCGSRKVTANMPPWCCAADNNIFPAKHDCITSPSCHDEQCRIIITFDKSGNQFLLGKRGIASDKTEYCPGDNIVITIEFLEEDKHVDYTKISAILKKPGNVEIDLFKYLKKISTGIYEIKGGVGSVGVRTLEVKATFGDCKDVANASQYTVLSKDNPKCTGGEEKECDIVTIFDKEYYCEEDRIEISTEFWNKGALSDPTRYGAMMDTVNGITDITDDYNKISTGVYVFKGSVDNEGHHSLYLSAYFDGCHVSKTEEFFVYSKEECPHEPKCTDTDGGKNYYVKGYATTDSGHTKHQDSCTYDQNAETHTLHETYCENNEIKTEAYKCPDTCEDGACIRDEYNQFSSNTIIVYGAQASIPDYTYCLSELKVKYPDHAIKQDDDVNASDKGSKNLILLSGPAGNRLVAELADVGKTPTIAEWMDEYQDCYIVQIIEDAYTVGKDVLIIAGWDVVQSKNACNHFLENKAPTPKTCVGEEEPKCTDTDGGKNYYVKGYATTDSGHTKHQDSCTYDQNAETHTLHETYCENNEIKTEAYKCPDTCEDGACIKEGERGYDVCNNNIGWSEPESAAQDCHGHGGYIKDCCCCFLTSHIHDLSDTFNANSRVEIEYMPGFTKGCKSTMNVYSSEDGKTWNLFYTADVTQETWNPKTTYKETLTVPENFRYIKINIPDCYNDYSSARVLAGEEEVPCCTTTGKDVLVLHDQKKYAFIGFYLWLNALPIEDNKDKWEVLQRTIDWATDKKDHSGTKIIVFGYRKTDRSLSAIREYLVSAGYSTENIETRGQVDVKTLSSSYYQKFDLVIYAWGYPHPASEIIASSKPFITMSPEHTDDMGIGKGESTMHESRSSFYVVNNDYYPTEIYGLEELNFTSKIWTDAIEATDHGITLMGADKCTAKDVLILHDQKKYAFIGFYLWLNALPIEDNKDKWEVLQRTIDWATDKKDHSGTKIIVFGYRKTDRSLSAIREYLVSAGYSTENIETRGQVDARTLNSSYYQKFDLVIYAWGYPHPASEIIASSKPFITMSPGHTDDMGIGKGKSTMHESRSLFYVANNDYYPTEIYDLGELNFASKIWTDAIESTGHGIRIMSADKCTAKGRPDCIGEGEILREFGSVKGQCCAGLHEISSGYRNGIAYCTSEVCGNGECKALENEWNCPKDCKFECNKELNKEDCELAGGEHECVCNSVDCYCYCKCPCRTDSDCGFDRCGQGRNVHGGSSCYELRYKCENGACEYTQKEYESYSCAVYYDPESPTPEKCLDTCGDGVCKSPETKWWCPEDCKEVSKYLTVTSPNGGEKWAQGNKYKITWKLNNAPVSSDEKVGIYLVDDSRDGPECSSQGCESWKYRIAWNLPAGPSEYLWTIPESDKLVKVGNKYKIRIGKIINTQVEIGDYDESDSYFSIVEPGECTPEGGMNYFGKPPCCEGLTQVPNYAVAESNPLQCIATNDGSGVCTKCGDGKCGIGENVCNCPKDCGCRSNSECETDETSSTGRQMFCEFPQGKCSGPGMCTKKPEACPGLYNPVCGCDSKTYSNDCVRQSAGVSKRYDGKCSEQECGKEGELPVGKGCCRGLIPKGAAEIDSNGNCIYMKHLVCLKCGDKRCDPTYENKCNCPEDCEGESKYLTVTSPNGGETWQKENAYGITWRLGPKVSIKDRLAIYLVDESQNAACTENGACCYTCENWKLITSGTSASSGKYSWNVPSSQKTGSEYKIFTRTLSSDCSSGCVADMSDRHFSITEKGKVTCRDTDGGRDYYKKGYVSLQQTLPSGSIVLLKQKTDSCDMLTDAHSLGGGSSGVSNTGTVPGGGGGSSTGTIKKVLEYYCEGNEIKSESRDCPNGCKDGACIKGKEPYCSEIATESEGWYKQGRRINTDKCDGCYPVCKYAGTKSEGWYSSCNSKLIIREDCGQVEKDCYSDKDCDVSSTAPNQFCEFPEGTCKGPGKCTEKSDICPGLYAPVCGCDGKTYSNDCVRQDSGVSKRHNGKCREEPPCKITSASLYCTDGSSSCEAGEQIRFNVRYSGSNCPSESNAYIQIDALSADGSCRIEYVGGDLSGIYSRTSGSTGLWTIPAIPDKCKGKTMAPISVGLYSGGPPGTGKGLDWSSAVTGRFELAGRSEKCTDSDGGRDYYKRGEIYWPVQNFRTKDVCRSGYVHEYYCEGDMYKETDYRCPNGCKEGTGACIKGREPYCSAIGTRSEGWYNNDGLVIWDNCDGCYAVCKYADTRSEGWYSSCDNKLIKHEECRGG